MTLFLAILGGFALGAICSVPRGPEDLYRDRLQAEFLLSGRHS